MTQSKNNDILPLLLVLALQVFLLTFAMRYVGFNSEQTMVLSLSIIGAIHIK